MDSSIQTLQSFSSSSYPKWWSEGTVAVVTGANRGIGFAFVKRLAELGLTVVLTARDIAKGQAAADSLRTQNLPVVFRQLDVADQASVRAFVPWLRDMFGGLDILVNNAGVSFNGIEENSVEHAETVIKTNYYGQKQLIEALLPLFRRSSAKSRILNLSSQLGLVNQKLRNSAVRETLQDEGRLTEDQIKHMVTQFLGQVKDGSWEKGGWPKVWTDYSVSKLALNAYSNILARRHRGLGLAVNCYCPGFTRTDMTGGHGSHTAEEAAEFGSSLVLLHPDQLPTGKFFKWSRSSLPSRL